VDQVPRGSGVENGDDVRVLERGGDLDLALEPLGVDAGGHVGREHLHHDPAAKGHVLRDEDAAHPRTAQLVDDAIRAAERGLYPVLELAQRLALSGFTGILRRRTRGGQLRASRRGPDV